MVSAILTLLYLFRMYSFIRINIRNVISQLKKKHQTSSLKSKTGKKISSALSRYVKRFRQAVGTALAEIKPRDIFPTFQKPLISAVFSFSSTRDTMVGIYFPIISSVFLFPVPCTRCVTAAMFSVRRWRRRRQSEMLRDTIHLADQGRRLDERMDVIPSLIFAFLGIPFMFRAIFQFIWWVDASAGWNDTTIWVLVYVTRDARLSRY